MDTPITPYTPTAQSSLAIATHEATTMHAANIEPEHILLGLLSPNSGTAWNLLVSVMRDPSVLRQALVAALAGVSTSADSATPTYSFRAQRVLTEATEEARRANSLQIDTSHLLLGLLDEGGAAAQILRQRGLDAQALRYWLRQPQPALAPQAVKPMITAQPARSTDIYYAPLSKALPRLINWLAVIILIGILVIGGWMTTRPDLDRIGTVVFVIGGWILSLSAHEFAHALVADLGGDHTVRDKGYLSFNPLKYTHLLLSIVMPLIFLLAGGIGLPGGAVYIDHSRLRGPKWESAVSAAGPFASLSVAVLMSVPFMLGLVKGSALFGAQSLWSALAAVVMLNIVAVILNLLPIPPLDGFGIIAPWLAPDLRARLYSFGFIGILVVFFVLWSFQPVNEALWSSVDTILVRLGVNPLLAALGLAQLTFLR